MGWLVGTTFGEGIGIGATVGILQWLVLRPLVHQAGWWLFLSTVGWAMGQVVVEIALPPGSGMLAGLVLGGMMGTAQWFALRRWVRSDRWWIVASIVGWTLGLNGVVGPALVGAVAGAVTGIALELLLRSPRSAE